MNKLRNRRKWLCLEREHQQKATAKQPDDNKMTPGTRKTRGRHKAEGHHGMTRGTGEEKKGAAGWKWRRTPGPRAKFHQTVSAASFASSQLIPQGMCNEKL